MSSYTEKRINEALRRLNQLEEVKPREVGIIYKEVENAADPSLEEILKHSEERGRGILLGLRNIEG